MIRPEFVLEQRDRMLAAVRKDPKLAKHAEGTVRVALLLMAEHCRCSHEDCFKQMVDGFVFSASGGARLN